MVSEKDMQFIWVILDELIEKGLIKENYVKRLENIKHNLNIERKDMLESIFEQQINLQIKCGHEVELLEGNQPYITVMTVALIDEAMEALRETPWKPWKKQQQFNKEKMQEELVDLLHFFVNLCLASGMDAKKLFEVYTYKNAINHQRQEDGY